MNKYSKIAEGLASWLTFEQRCGREALFRESYLAYPMHQILQHEYSGRVLLEVKHPVLAEKKVGRGRNPSIDFAVIGGSGIYDLAIETKWVSKSPTLLRDILRDVIRIDLLVPNYAKESLLIMAGKAKDFSELFQNQQFQPHPDHANSRSILPLGDPPTAAVRFAPVSEFRRKLYSQALKPFRELEISTSIPMALSGPFPPRANMRHFVVYVWRIRSSDKTPKFIPSELYDLG